MMVSNSFNNRIEPGFNATEKRIEPGLDAAPKPAGTWWYRNAGVDIGPVTEEQMQALVSGKVVNRSTMVWRDEFGADWKRLDETALWTEPAGPPAFEQPVSPRWQKAFEAAAELEGTWSLVNRTGTRRSMGQRMKAQWTLFSIPGFFFGPFYYFYLRMWRKGVVIMGVVPITIVIEDLVGSTRGFSSVVGVFCATRVKLDYFKFRTKGEIMWPSFKMFRNIYVDLGVLAALFVAAIAVEGMQGDASDVAPTKAVAETAAADPTTQHLAPGIISIRKKPDFKSSLDDPSYNILITSKVTHIRIDRIAANRGNCYVLFPGPHWTDFGQVAEAYAQCNPIEIKVETNMGVATYTFGD